MAILFHKLPKKEWVQKIDPVTHEPYNVYQNVVESHSTISEENASKEPELAPCDYDIPDDPEDIPFTIHTAGYF